MAAPTSPVAREPAAGSGRRVRGAKPPEGVSSSPADAAAASFADLVVELDHPDAADILRVRDAYRFGDARDLRADRAPARPEPDLPRAAGALVRAPLAVAARGAFQGGAEGARLSARRRRAHPEGRGEGPLAGQAQGPGLRPREDALFDLSQDAREAPELRAGQRHLRLSHRRLDPDRVLRRDGRAAPADEADARPLQGLHRDPEGERPPAAAHDARVAPWHPRRVPDPPRADARGGREAPRGALDLQGARR